MKTELSLYGFSDFAKPDFSIIKHIHRQHDGYIAFCTREQRFGDVGSVLPDYLDTFYSFSNNKLEQDGCFSLFSYYDRFLKKNWKRPDFVQRTFRKSIYTRHITCLFADIDCDEYNLNKVSVLEKINQLSEKQIIPVPTIEFDSGCGLWFIWLIHKNGKLVRYFDDGNVQKWKALQSCIHKCLEENDLPVDSKVNRFTELLRVPGSLNMKSKTRVNYRINLNQDGKPIEYDINAVCKRYNIKYSINNKYCFTPNRNGPKSQRHKISRLFYWRYLVENLELLNKLRCGIKEGYRNSFIYYYTIAQRALGKSKDEIRLFATELNQNFKPPLIRYELDKTIDSGYGSNRYPKNISYEKLIAIFRITEEELSQLKCIRKIDPKQIQKLQEKKAEKAQRQRAVKHIKESYPGLPLRKIEELLKDDFGFNVSHVTIRKDLISLGLASC